jgi:hypothetical protein
MRLTFLDSLFIASMALLATTASVVAADGEQVEYRLTDWKTIHFEDATKGDAHLKAVKDLGCEVKNEKHDGHTDVSYRCKDWMKMTLASHEAVHRWEKWLKAAGFETKHTH